jgi:hypothetical protein
MFVMQLASELAWKWLDVAEGPKAAAAQD